MKKAISITAIILLGIIASPIALGLIFFLLGAVLGLVAAAVGVLAFVITWLVPIILLGAGLFGLVWLILGLLD